MDVSRLYYHIVDVARREDSALRGLGEGIFSVPERAFVFQVGKALASDARAVFGSDDARWRPEMKIGDSGPSDLVFEVDGSLWTVIEFKMRGTITNISDDLTKLARVSATKYRRFFCALIDAWPEKLSEDPRVRSVEEWQGPGSCRATRVKRDFDFFSPLDATFAKQVCCVVGCWEIVGGASAT